MEIASATEPFAITDGEFERFKALAYEQTGIALGENKRQLVCSRLGKRLRHHGYTTFSQYYDHLTARDPEGDELLQMINAITTNKTDFFREAHHFAFLRQEVLGPMAARALAGGPRRLRIWSAGCSSGEEPYSIAVTVSEGLANGKTWDVRMLASDIDTDMLARAMEGVYPEERAAGVPRAFLERYFLRGRGPREGLVRPRREVREMVTFRRINLRDEAWPIRAVFDCIFCRNVIIYFDKLMQHRLITRFADYLKPGGYLILGHSESLLGLRVGFRYLGQTVYQKVDGNPEPSASREGEP